MCLIVHAYMASSENNSFTLHQTIILQPWVNITFEQQDHQSRNTFFIYNCWSFISRSLIGTTFCFVTCKGFSPWRTTANIVDKETDNNVYQAAARLCRCGTKHGFWLVNANISWFLRTFISDLQKIGVVSVGCDDATATIQSVADATQIASCDSIEGSVVIAPGSGQSIDLSGDLTEIGGDLIVDSNALLSDFSSTSLETIGGSFTLKNLTALSTLSFSRLSEVGSIDWATLTLLPELNFGTPGITKAKSVVIADTFIETIDGINVQSLTDMNLNNNKRLTKFSTSIKSLSNVLNVQANGLNLELEMPNLEWIANLTIANVTTFSAPSLKTVNGSMRFDSNYFESFSAPNLTEVQDGDISFVSNPQLTNLSFPSLERIGGGLTVANNTALEQVDSFKSLERVGGAVAFRGSFTDVELPALTDVVGGFEVVSTEDLTDTCDTLGDLGSVVQGEYTCTGKEADANSNTGDADGSTGDSGSGSGSGSSDEGAAVALGLNINTLVSLAALGAVFTTFL